MNQQNQKKLIARKKIEVHPNEEWLIKIWRKKYRYGEITVIMQDGLPVRIKQTISVEAPPPIQR